MTEQVQVEKRGMFSYFLASGGVLAILIIIGAIFQVGNPVDILWNRIGFTPSMPLKIALFGLTVISWLALSLLLISMKEVKTEYQEYKNAESQKAEPVSPPSTPVALTPKDHIKAYYTSERYHKIDTLVQEFHDDEHTIGYQRSVELYAQEPELDISNVWRRRAVLIYDDGKFSSFQIAVLYSDEAWQKADTLHIQQKRRGRPVHIRKALDRPFMKTMLTKSDFALCFGLASSEKSDPPDRNETYANDRAWHCGSAIVGLEFQSSARVRAFSLGYALTETSDPEILARQRSVIVVGVDTAFSPKVDDIVQAIGELVTLTGVDFDAYSRSGLKHIQYFRIPADDFGGTADVGMLEEPDPDTDVLVPLLSKHK